MVKLCIWMNIPSHYQNDFFQALENRDDVDLQVVYFDAVPQDRIEEGWKDARALKPYENVCSERYGTGAASRIHQRLARPNSRE